MRDYPHWMAWRAHRKRLLVARWAVLGYVIGWLLGRFALQVPEPVATAVLGLVLGVLITALLLGPGGHVPTGWPGWRCIWAAAEDRVPPNRYGCWNRYAQPSTGPCWCKRAELQEARIDAGIEYPYLLTPTKPGDPASNDPHLW